MTSTIEQSSRGKRQPQVSYREPLKKINNLQHLDRLTKKDREPPKIEFSQIKLTESQPHSYLNSQTHSLKLIENPYLIRLADISPFGKESSRSIYKNSGRNSVSIKDLEITIDRINELADEDEEDEYGEIIHPTEYANQIAIELVSKAANLIPQQFFKAWVSSEDAGGIRLTWSKLELGKDVRLVIPSSSQQKIHLYHEVGDEYGIEYNVSAKTLSHWLSWCNPK